MKITYQKPHHERDVYYSTEPLQRKENARDTSNYTSYDGVDWLACVRGIADPSKCRYRFRYGS